jgi:hypothetical protein
MKNKILWFAFNLMIASSLQVNAQDVKQDSTYRKWFVGSSLFLLGNFDKTNNPEYIQLNTGYRITPKDVVSLDFKRSVYAWPLGISLASPSFDKRYPGHARILAPTIGYQRFLWKGAFISLHALNAFEKYFDENNKKIGNGYTLYLNLHVGYQFKFFNNRFFFEPAIACSYWPVRTGVPESFKVVEKKWDNSVFQPGLNFGYNFDFKKKNK